jgi:regulator of protease activity HflC (stomatin/prohibitin superfamily)
MASLQELRSAPSPFAIGTAVVAGLLGIVLLVVLFATLGSFERTNAGEYAVIRNGGPLDDRNVRQVILPGSGLTWTGLFSSKHKYPAQQRFYTITADPSRADSQGVDVVRVPTSDGVNVGLEGTIYFRLTDNPQLLKQFDNRFGTRRFRVVGDTGSLAPWEGDAGWSAFLDAIVRPVIDNDLRQEIGSFRCAELVSSCALVQSGSQGARQIRFQTDGNANIQEVQDRINESLAADIRSTLGANYLIGIRFNLVKVELPANVQRAVDEAQAEFAQVSRDQAGVKRARLQNQRNRELAKTLRQNPILALAEVFKSLPDGSRPIINVDVGGAKGPGINLGR